MKNIREENVNVRLTVKEKKLFEQQAKKEGLSTSDYIRMCAYMDCAINGPKAKTWKILFDIAKYSFAKKIEDRLLFLENFDFNCHAQPEITKNT